MSLYDLEFNKDDVLIRNIIIGVLASLHNKLNWYNKIDNTTKKQIDMPFFFSTTGDERFLQDMFLQDITYDAAGKIAETAYNQIPRGIIELTGVEIDPARLSNQSVRGTYEKEVENGIMKSYSAEFIPIPLNLAMDITILVDSMLDQFKAVEAIIRNIYKDNTFQIHVGGIRIPGTFGVPEGTQLDRTIEFRSGTTDKKEMKVVFSIDVTVEYPIFKTPENGFSGPADTEMFNGNTMVGMSMFNRLGATATAGVNIDPGLGNSLTSNQASTNFNDGDELPDDRAWPFGPHKR